MKTKLRIGQVYDFDKLPMGAIFENSEDQALCLKVEELQTRATDITSAVGVNVIVLCHYIGEKPGYAVNFNCDEQVRYLGMMNPDRVFVRNV